MKRQRLAVAALGLLGLGLLVGGGSASAAPAGPRRITAIGDSITADGRYLMDLAGLFPAAGAASIGEVGWGAERVFRELLPVALDNAPTDLIVLVGVNDLAAGRSAANIAAWLDRIYTAAAARGVRVVAVTVLPWGAWLAGRRFEGRRAAIQAENNRLNAWIRAQAGRVRVVDASPLGDAAGRLLYTADGLHPDRQGHAQLAALIYRGMT